MIGPILLAASIWFGDEPAKPAKPPVRVVAVSQTIVDADTEAAKRLAEAERILRETPAYKDYQLALKDRQAMALYLMAEAGAKPSECKEQRDKDGKLTGFECVEKPKDK